LGTVALLSWPKVGLFTTAGSNEIKRFDVVSDCQDLFCVRVQVIRRWTSMEDSFASIRSDDQSLAKVGW
jgi:hypothetical protein